MTGTTRWLKTIARIEFRSILANPWRTLLIIALIGVPVAAIVGGNNLLFVTRATPAERSITAMGTADLRIETWRSAEEVLADLPDGSSAEPISVGDEQIILNGLRLSIGSCHLDLNGAAAGIRHLAGGVLPDQPGEVAVSQSILEIGDLKIGDSISLTSEEFSIVGVVENHEKIEAPEVLYPLEDGKCPNHTALLVSLPEGVEAEAAIQNLSGDDHVVIRSSAANELPKDAALVFIIGGFALAEAALIVAAAFIVGVRRRQREIGLFASAGATQLQVLVSVLVSAALVSLVAVVAGLGLGLLAAWIAHPYLDSWNGRRNGAFEICWSIHIWALLMGIFTAVASALLPALSAARLPIKTALSSRRPVPGNAMRSLFFGLVIVFGALATVTKAKQLAVLFGWTEESSALLVMLGSGAGVIGLGICSPFILGFVAKGASWLPLSWRLAVRETGRFRTRNGPIVTAIVAGMALSVMFATIYKSVLDLDTEVSQVFADNHVLVMGPAAEDAAAKIVDDFDGLGSTSISKVTLRGRPIAASDAKAPEESFQVAVGDGRLLKALGISDPDGRLEAALNQDKMIALGKDSSSSITLFPLGSRDSNLKVLDVVSVDSKRIGPIGYIMSPATMKRNKWSPRDGIIRQNVKTQLVRMPSSVDRELFAKAAAVASTFPQTSITAQCEFKTDRSQLWSFFFVSLLSGLVVIAIATALASAESKSDQKVLSTVGAPPSVSRHQSAARSAFLALLGCLLAIPAGMLPAYGVIDAVSRLSFSIPWTEVFVVAIGLPVAAYFVTYVGARIGTPKSSF